MSLARSSPLALVAVLSIACAGSGGEGPAHTVRDSAGVRIVENARPAWKPGKAWALDSTLLVIGVSDSGAGQQLHRVTGAVRLGDATLVVADGGSQQLFRYDHRGSFLGAMGRPGDGPGEFRSVTWLGRMAADSLIVWDRGLNRVTIFSPTGEFARNYPPKLSNSPMFLEVKGGLDGRRLLFTRGASYIPTGGVPGVQRQPMTAWIVDSAGMEIASVGPFAGETVTIQQGRQAGTITRMPVPYGATALFASGGDAVHIVDTDAFAVRTYSPDGRLRAISRRPHEPRRVQPEDVKALIDAEMENLPPIQAVRDGMRASYERITPAPNLPAIHAIRVDSEANVWVRSGASSRDTTATWDIFDREGRWQGTLPLPAAMDILEIGPDYAIVRDRDDLGVERVRVLRLRKQPAT